MGTTSPRPGLTGPLPLPWEPGSLLLPGPQAGEFHIIHILFNSSPLAPETTDLSIIVTCSPHCGFGPWILEEGALHSSFLSPTLIMLLLQPAWDREDGTSRPARQVKEETSVRSHTPQPLQADFRPGPALAPPLPFPGTQAPHPYSAFHLFFPPPPEIQGGW